MKRFFVFSVGVGLGLILIWVLPAAKRNGGNMEGQEQRYHVNEIHAALTQGYGWLNTSRDLTPEDFSGRILLLDFWTFCCINCMHVLPDLHALEHEFGDDLTVVGVHSGKFSNERDTNAILEAVIRYDIEHPVINDATFTIWKNFNVHAWPTLILINPDGRIEQVYTGEGHREELRRDIIKIKRAYEGRINTTKLPIALEKTKRPTTALSFPGKLTYAPDRDLLFISDSNRHRILGVKLSGEVVMTIGKPDAPGSNDGSFERASFNRPQGLLYRQGALYVADTENHLLRKIDLESKGVTTLAGTGKQGQERFAFNAEALKTPLSSPWDLTFYDSDDEILIAMAGTHQLWTYSIPQKTLNVVAGSGLESIDDGTYPQNSLSQPSGLSSVGGKHYFVDSETSSLRVVETGKVKTLIGTGLFNFGYRDGKAKEALLQHPIGLFADTNGIYIADSYNHSIRFYDPVKGWLATIAGKGDPGFEDGPWEKAHFNEPNAIIKIGNQLYVTDTNNHQIRVIDLDTKVVKTLKLIFPNDRQARTTVDCEGDVCVPAGKDRST